MGLENPYFDIFKGKQVPLSEILAHNSGYMISVRQKIQEGDIVGQYDLWGDCILRLAKPLDKGIIAQVVEKVVLTNGILEGEYPLLKGLVGSHA